MSNQSVKCNYNPNMVQFNKALKNNKVLYTKKYLSKGLKMDKKDENLHAYK